MKDIITTIENIAKSTPNRIAIKTYEYNLSYKDLNHQVNQYAHFIAEKFHVADHEESIKRIGILNERDLVTLRAMLACWKLGLSFVLLDPSKEAKINLKKLCKTQCQLLITKETILKPIISDEKAKLNQENQEELIITKQHSKDEPSSYKIKILCIDRFKTEIKKQKTYNPKKVLIYKDEFDEQDYLEDITNLSCEAYVMFTSGSTGMPKACLCHHAGLVDFLDDIGNIMEINNDTDTMLWNISLEFDPVIFVPAMSFIRGGSIYIPNADENKNISLLYQHCVDKNVNVMLLVPSLAKQGDEYAKLYFKKIRNLRLIFTGEAFTEKLYDFYSQYTDAKIFNAYGPTEGPIGLTTNLITSASEISIGNDIKGREIKILTPIDKTRENYAKPKIMKDKDTYFLEGELLYRSLGFAGYLNADDKTNDRKVNPKEWEGWWKTGDRIRILCDQDGEFIRDSYHNKPILTYIERYDNELKIMGVRINPDYLAGMLKKHPKINKANVIIVYPPNMPPKIVIFYQSESIDFSELDVRRYLKNKDSRVINCEFVDIEKIGEDWPVAGGGKFDKRKAEALYLEFKARSSSQETKISAIVKEIWQEILCVPKDSLNDDSNFFDLGADSFDYVILKNCLRTHQRLKFNLDQNGYEQYFEKRTTIDNLARLIDLNMGREHLIKPIHVDNNKPYIFLHGVEELNEAIELEELSMNFQIYCIKPRENKANLFSDDEERNEDFFQTIHHLQAIGPYYIIVDDSISYKGEIQAKMGTKGVLALVEKHDFIILNTNEFKHSKYSFTTFLSNKMLDDTFEELKRKKEQIINSHKIDLLNKPSLQTENVFIKLKEFLQRSVPICYLYGASGSGKTNLLRSYVATLESDKDGDAREIFPIYISIRNTKHLLAELHSQLHPSEISHLQKQEKFLVVFILDGLDRLQLLEPINLYERLELQNWKYPKIIASYATTTHPQKFYQCFFAENNRVFDSMKIHLNHNFILSEPKDEQSLAAMMRNWFDYQYNRLCSQRQFDKNEIIKQWIDYCIKLSKQMGTMNYIQYRVPRLENYYQEKHYNYELDVYDEAIYLAMQAAPIEIIDGEIRFVFPRLKDYFSGFPIEDFALYTGDSRLIQTPTPAIKSVDDYDVTVTPYNAEGSQQQLFLFPPITGKGGYYKLARYFHKNQPIVEFQHPYYGDHQKQFSNINELAHHYATIIEKTNPKGPIALAGWSFGGYVAIVLAKLMQERGRIINYLGMIDTPAPLLYNQLNYADHICILKQLITWMVKFMLIERIFSKKINREGKDYISLCEEANIANPNESLEKIIAKIDESAKTKESLSTIAETAFDSLLNYLDVEVKTFLYEFSIFVSSLVSEITVTKFNYLATVDMLNEAMLDTDDFDNICIYLADTSHPHYELMAPPSQKLAWPKNVMGVTITNSDHFTITQQSPAVEKLAIAMSQHLERFQIPVIPKFFTQLLEQYREIKKDTKNYVPLKYTLSPNDVNPEGDISESLKTFIASDKNIFILLGPSGSGKTQLSYNLFNQIQTDGAIIPIYIDLSYAKDNYLLEYFASYGFSIKQICAELRTNHRFLLILDGMDQAIKGKWDILSEIREWRKIQVILTSRQEYLPEQFYKQLNDEKWSYQRFYISPFDNGQIETLVEHHHFPLGTFNEYNTKYGLAFELLANPLNLSLLLVIYTNGDQEFLQEMVIKSRMDIFKVFLSQRILSTAIELDVSWQSQFFKRLEQYANEFAMSLALSIQDNTTGDELIEDSTVHDISHLIKSKRFEVLFTLRALPLNENKDIFRFNHQSFTAFYFALHLFNSLFNIKDISKGKRKSFTYNNTFLPKHIFNRINLCDDLEILSFLRDIIANLSNEDQKHIIDLLFKIILSTKDKRDTNDYTIAASNAATLLTLLQPDIFSHKNLSGVTIPYADLRQSILHHVDLRNAILTETNLSHCWMQGANLSNASLGNTSFGLDILMQHETSILKIITLNDNLMAVFVDDGYVYIYNTNNNKLKRKINIFANFEFEEKSFLADTFRQFQERCANLDHNLFNINSVSNQVGGTHIRQHAINQRCRIGYKERMRSQIIDNKELNNELIQAMIEIKYILLLEIFELVNSENLTSSDRDLYELHLKDYEKKKLEEKKLFLYLVHYPKYSYRTLINDITFEDEGLKKTFTLIHDEANYIIKSIFEDLESISKFKINTIKTWHPMDIMNYQNPIIVDRIKAFEMILSKFNYILKLKVLSIWILEWIKIRVLPSLERYIKNYNENVIKSKRVRQAMEKHDLVYSVFQNDGSISFDRLHQRLYVLDNLRNCVQVWRPKEGELDYEHEHAFYIVNNRIHCEKPINSINNYRNEYLSCLSVNEAGDKLALGTYKGNLYIIDLETNQSSNNFSFHEKVITLGFSDSNSLIVALFDGNILCYDVENNEVENYDKKHNDQPTCLRVNHPKQQLITTSLDGTVHVHNLKEKFLIHSFHLDFMIHALALNHQQGFCVVSGKGSRVCILDLNKFTINTSLQLNLDIQIVTALAEIDQQIILGSWNGTLEYIDPLTNAATIREGYYNDIHNYLGDSLIYCSSGSEIRILQLSETNSKLFYKHAKPIYLLEISNDKKLLAIVDTDHIISIYDDKLKKIREIHNTCKLVKLFFIPERFGNEGRHIFLITIDEQGAIKTWNEQDQPLNLREIGQYIHNAIIDLNDKVIYLFYANKIGIYHIQRNQFFLKTNLHHDHHISAGSTSNTVEAYNNDSCLVTGDREGVIKLWRQVCLDDYRLKTELKGHKKEIISLKHSHDDKFIASASIDKTVRIWRGSSCLHIINSVIEAKYLLWQDDYSLFLSNTLYLQHWTLALIRLADDQENISARPKNIYPHPMLNLTELMISEDIANGPHKLLFSYFRSIIEAPNQRNNSIPQAERTNTNESWYAELIEERQPFILLLNYHDDPCLFIYSVNNQHEAQLMLASIYQSHQFQNRFFVHINQELVIRPCDLQELKEIIDNCNGKYFDANSDQVTNLLTNLKKRAINFNKKTIHNKESFWLDILKETLNTTVNNLDNDYRLDQVDNVDVDIPKQSELATFLKSFCCNII